MTPAIAKTHAKAALQPDGIESLPEIGAINP
jgi:hypothetical protein